MEEPWTAPDFIVFLRTELLLDWTDLSLKCCIRCRDYVILRAVEEEEP
jgi:hypothetical protein